MNKTILLGLFLLLFSCTKNNEFKFISDKEFLSTHSVDGVLFGGVSGIVSVSPNTFFGISDDRGEKGVPRFFKLNLSDLNNFSIYPARWTPLLNEEGERFEVGSIDFEGMTLLPTGNILISSEGDNRLSPIVPPRISEYDQNGNFIRYWPLPEKFIPNGLENQTRGVGQNVGLESLTSTEDGRYVFTANEEPLIQDESEDKKTNPLRIVKYEYGKIVGEYVYNLEQTPNPDNFEVLKGNNGLVDLLAIDGNKLIAVERAFVKNNYRNIIRLYLIDLKDATNVLHKESLKGVEYKSVSKKLAYDLDSLVDKLQTKKLDNIEGIAWGPLTVDGKRTLILVSDNNFSKHQRTLFIQLEF